MMNGVASITAAIWISLLFLSVFLVCIPYRDLVRRRKVLENISLLKTVIIRFGINFFDVLSVSVFAPKTALLNFIRHTEDIVFDEKYADNVKVFENAYDFTANQLIVQRVDGI